LCNILLLYDLVVIVAKILLKHGVIDKLLLFISYLEAQFEGISHFIENEIMGSAYITRRKFNLL